MTTTSPEGLGRKPVSAPPDGGYTGPPLTAPIRPEGLALMIDQAARAVYCGETGHKLTPAQWATLRYFQHAANGDQTMMGLVRYQRIAPATASETIALLVKRGLLNKERNPNDRRQFLLQLTGEARTLMAQDPLNRLADAITTLDEPTRRCLADGLERIVHLMRGGTVETTPPRSPARPGRTVD